MIAFLRKKAERCRSKNSKILLKITLSNFCKKLVTKNVFNEGKMLTYYLQIFICNSNVKVELSIEVSGACKKEKYTNMIFENVLNEGQ